MNDQSVIVASVIRIDPSVDRTSAAELSRGNTGGRAPECGTRESFTESVWRTSSGTTESSLCQTVTLPTIEG